MIAALRSLLSVNGMLVGAIAIGGLLIYLDQSRVRRIRSEAVSGQIQKTETANAIVKKTGRAAQRGSSDPATPGVLDPYVRPD